VLIVDDHPAVRVGLQGLLDAEPDLSSVAAVATARGALAEAERLTPDVAVVDYQLGDRDGLTLARQLKNLARPPRVLIYSAYADAPMTVAAVIAGADGIASKGGRGDDLCLAIRAVGAGRPALPTILPDALRAMAGRLDAGDVPILAMLVHGTPADEIADVLGITHDWLDARRWSILKRLTASPRLTRLRRPPPPQRTGR
jgi:DNA-binding NarL/FixJ family response regulator